MLVTVVASTKRTPYGRRLAALSAGALLAVPALAAPAAAAGPDLDRFERAAVVHLNSFRSAQGLPPLTLDPRLEGVSDAHSAGMAARRVFAHSTGSLVRRVGARHVGELIARVSGPGGRVYRNEAARIVRGWMASPTHRTVLLRPRYRRIGVARRRGNGTSYYTATLASRP
jgi:uncharacterized protein YkwD